MLIYILSNGLRCFIVMSHSPALCLSSGFRLQKQKALILSHEFCKVKVVHLKFVGGSVSSYVDSGTKLLGYNKMNGFIGLL